MKTVLIANRGEIAIRIARAVAEAGMRSIAVHAEDDARALHVRRADLAVPLAGRGAAAYLNIDALIEAAHAHGCDAVHPGYGFLSERADFAQRCEDAGLRFIGPSPEVLRTFGDKARARELAARCGVPLAAGTNRATTLAEAHAFLAEHGAIMVKALAGGGGRGMRAVRDAASLDDAFARCESEARTAFGDGALYVERLLDHARHVEVQIVGDGAHASHLWERDCSLQRRHQKVIEIAPAPGLNATLRRAIIDAALTLARAVNYRGIGTFEFLVDIARGDFVFMEANPRVQVEHCVTEAVTGVDLVRAQLSLAQGATLADLKLSEPPPVRGYAVQARVNLEAMQADGSARAAGGVLVAYEPPSGAGLRVDGYGYAGYATSPNYDSLIAKLIAHADDFPGALRRAARGLGEFRLEGVANNIGFLQALLRRAELPDYAVDTRFIERHIGELLATSNDTQPERFFRADAVSPGVSHDALSSQTHVAPPGCVALTAPSQGVLVCLDVQPGDTVAIGQQIAVLEAMKMEFVVEATQSGIVRALSAEPNDTVFEGAPLVFIEPADVASVQMQSEESRDLSHIRADLAEVLERHALTRDERRPHAVARRRKTGQRTARENLDDLLDADSFVEYGALALAAQRGRRPLDDLITQSPADGLIAGIGTVNAARVGGEAARCMAVAYDYTVFAGTQGMMSHKKTDRMLQLAEQWRLPLVLFAEGGGGRPGDTDHVGVAGLDCRTFASMARLSGQVPLVGVVSGRCFAGNAALLGCCDVIIATRNASIGMAGPAMIEGGGLGKFTPEEVGPASVQAPNGVIDVLVDDEAAAVQVAKHYLSYFQGPIADWTCADQRLLREAIPENRLRVYDIRRVIEMLVDQDSMLELRRAFAPGLITALVRIEGKPFGLLANNPMHLGGAIDAQAGDKAARFMQLCDTFGLPLLSLCDTPGFMVGPQAEKQATVRHVSRMFVAGASLRVPFFTVVLRKGYGLGAQAMAAGSFHAPLFTIAWPSGEFGAMGLEGAVRLGYAKELAAIDDPAQREAQFERMVADAYRNGKAINMASFLEIDSVIDPAETRRWLMRGLNASHGFADRAHPGRRFVDTW
ncbi:biotin-dependent enzyme [Paraburkholderia eburnea]|uniref:acetyl-CoA carboxylase n=1 Tax=Paraburkholderia eburnea TaxID=1189126 RepID=A0A2S4LVK8_9BURK|nr:carboxyl transferase domain-containing protein [Paraburkholderia eburnea]POR46464.1 biotin-dependent enzyme [Paraburkholderia eburnea]PRZ20823.1 biotin-dependent enzyme [Paraburkholderia eburnea]